MQGPWPTPNPVANLSELIERAGGRAYDIGRNDDVGGRKILIEFDKRLARQLMVAAQAGDIGNVRTALAQRADPNCQLQTGIKSSALHLAAAAGSPEIAQLLLQAGALPSLEDAQGKTPIDAALAAGSTAVVIELLLTSNQDVIATLGATHHRWIGVLHAVLQRAGKVPSEANVNRRLDHGRLDETKRLVNLIASVSASASWQSTDKAKELRRAWFLCVMRGWNGAVLALLTGIQGPAKLNPNTKDPKSRRTALELAMALYQHQTLPATPEVVGLMQTCGADESQGNPFFAEWALQLCAARNDVVGVAHWLPKVQEIDWREPPPPGDLQGGMRCTALMIAAMEGHSDAVQALLEGRSAPWLMDSGGRNAGALARQRGHQHIADVLDARATSYVKRQLQQLPTEQEQRDFMLSLMPPQWTPPSGWEEAVDQPEQPEPVEPIEEPVEAPPRERVVDYTKLVFKVESATDLVTDWFQLQMDPYAQVTLTRPDEHGRYDRVGEVMTSSVVANTSNPEWNKEFHFNVVGSEIIQIAVMDEGVSDDALMGKTEVKLEKWSQQMRRGKRVNIDRRLQMQPRGANSGVIHLSLWYKSARKLNDDSDDEVAVGAKAEHELIRAFPAEAE